MPHPRPTPERLAAIRQSLEDESRGPTLQSELDLLAEVDARGDEMATIANTMATIRTDAAIEALESVDTAAQADIIQGGPITGAHHRAVAAQLQRLRLQQRNNNHSDPSPP